MALDPIDRKATKVEAKVDPNNVRATEGDSIVAQCYTCEVPWPWPGSMWSHSNGKRLQRRVLEDLPKTYVGLVCEGCVSEASAGIKPELCAECSAPLVKKGAGANLAAAQTKKRRGTRKCHTCAKPSAPPLP